MVFSSLPLYLDPPNWQHQPQGLGNHENQHHQHQPTQPPPPPQPEAVPQPRLGTGGGGGRPNSTAERARLAKIVPQPETPLKCPRCESTNTKFCYFNNYSLSQPRHFCKTCRRYWTRGGALRNVPVGGGCRRNNGKRSKSNQRPKSPAAASNTTTTSAVTTTAATNLVSNIHHHQTHLFLQPSYLATLQNLNRLGMGNLGLNLEMPDGAPFQACGSYDNAPAQELPFLGGGGGFEAMSSASASPLINPYLNFHDGGSALQPSYDSNDMMMMRSTTTRGNDNGDDHDQMVLAQMNGVKMDNQVGNMISKQLMGMSLPGHSNDHQIWGGAGAGADAGAGANDGNVWTDLSGITSSSAAAVTTHMLS